jgi:S-formylglutathione hydrolase
MNMLPIKSHKTFQGKTEFWSHDSSVTGTKMKFSTFIPDGGARGCIIWLSGLTCTEENFITKAGAQKYLSDNQLMVICPDTSPRGLNLPHEHDSYDFGSGAGFYLNATTEGYSKHYKMYDYIVDELDNLIRNEFGVHKISIMGHSMGGHGALVIGLRNPEKYQSISAFSPIVNPIASPWGIKAFKGYLGEDKSTWNQYDATELLKSGKTHPKKILVHQGTHDEYLTNQLFTTHFIDAAQEVGQQQEVVFAEEYDHSYYFIATFIGAHITHHARYLK